MWTFRKRNAIYKRFPESVQSRCLPSLQLVTRLDQFPKDASREGFAGGSSKKLSISRFPSETANKYNVSKRHPLSFSQTSKLQGCNDGLSMTFESALKRSGSCMQSPKMATHRSVLQCRTVHCLSSLHRHSYGPTSASLDQAKGQYAQRISVSHKHMACAIT